MFKLVLCQLQMDTDNISLNWPNLSFFSVRHTLMDRFFFPDWLGSPGWTQDKTPEQDANYNVLQRSIRHRSKRPSWAESNTFQLMKSKKWVKFLQPAGCRLQHLRYQWLQTAPLKSRGMQTLQVPLVFSFQKKNKTLKMRQQGQIGHKQGFDCIDNHKVRLGRAKICIFFFWIPFQHSLHLKQKINIQWKILGHKKNKNDDDLFQTNNFCNFLKLIIRQATDISNQSATPSTATGSWAQPKIKF